MPTITVDYFGFSGSGKTVKDAKLDAGRKIEQLHKGSWSPVLIEWRGFAVFVYRNLDAWQYTWICDPTNGFRSYVGGGCSYDDRESAVHAAKMHVADNGGHNTDADLERF